MSHANTQKKSPSDTPELLPVEMISKLASIELAARLVVEGLMTGIHRSPRKGFSTEFADHRQYVAGDDLRLIDWVVYAKTDHYYIKQFEGETNVRLYLLLDCSGSMRYTSGEVTKLRYGQCLAASLAYLMIKQRDSAGLVTFDQKIREFLPPRSVPSHMVHMLRTLENIEAGGETAVAPILHEMAERIKRRAMVIVISDMFDDPEPLIHGLLHFRHNRHEVIVFHVVDPAELDFPFQKFATFRDLENGSRLELDPRYLRRSYQEEIGRFIENLRHSCAVHDIEYVLLNTQVPYDRALLAYLSKRTKLG